MKTWLLPALPILGLATSMTASAIEPRDNWSDSYSAGGQCYCATSFDHAIGPVEVETPAGTRTVREVCEHIGPGPGQDGNPVYNDVQCGHGPANDAGDEDPDVCPGRVDQGSVGCLTRGPTWQLERWYDANGEIFPQVDTTPAEPETNPEPPPPEPEPEPEPEPTSKPEPEPERPEQQPEPEPTPTPTPPVVIETPTPTPVSKPEPAVIDEPPSSLVGETHSGIDVPIADMVADDRWVRHTGEIEYLSLGQTDNPAPFLSIEFTAPRPGTYQFHALLATRSERGAEVARVTLNGQPTDVSLVSCEESMKWAWTDCEERAGMVVENAGPQTVTFDAGVAPIALARVVLAEQKSETPALGSARTVTVGTGGLGWLTAFLLSIAGVAGRWARCTRRS